MCAFNTMRVGDGSALLTDKSNGAHVYILDLTAFLVRPSTCAIIELIDGVIFLLLAEIFHSEIIAAALFTVFLEKYSLSGEKQSDVHFFIYYKINIRNTFNIKGI